MIHLIEENAGATFEAEVLAPQVIAQHRPATNNPMLLHCGGQLIERDALFGIPTPRASSTRHGQKAAMAGSWVCETATTKPSLLAL